MRKQISNYLILSIVIMVSNVFFDYQEGQVWLWKENLIEAFTLALIITFLMWLISPKKLKE
ncbi:MAG: hypothetical protein ACQEWW_24135 [Bacillota bacterium]|jgi:hypothetical protein